MNYTGQASFAEMFEYYCSRNVTNEREYNEREMMRWLKQQLTKARREGWEQAKKQAKDAVECANYDLDDWSRRNPEHVAVAAIAAMEYKEDV